MQGMSKNAQSGSVQRVTQQRAKDLKDAPTHTIADKFRVD